MGVQVERPSPLRTFAVLPQQGHDGTVDDGDLGLFVGLQQLGQHIYNLGEVLLPISAHHWQVLCKHKLLDLLNRTQNHSTVRQGHFTRFFTPVTLPVFDEM